MNNEENNYINNKYFIDKNEIDNNKELNKKKIIIFNKFKFLFFFAPFYLIIIYYNFLHFIFCCVNIFFSHKRFIQYEKNIIKKIFTDQYSDSTSSLLIESSFQNFIILLMPFIIYLFKNSEIFSFLLTLIFLMIYRFYNFFNIFQYSFKKLDLINDKKENDKLQNFKNNHDKIFISEKMYNSCLLIIELDIIFIFMFEFPLCHSISLHNLKVGFEYIIMIKMVSFCFQINNYLLNKNKDDKRNKEDSLFYPILNNISKTNLYLFIILTTFICTIFKFIMQNFYKKDFFNTKIYYLLMIFQIFFTICEELFNSFLDFCGTNNDEHFNKIYNNNIYIDKFFYFTNKNNIGYPICYYFIVNILKLK